MVLNYFLHQDSAFSKQAAPMQVLHRLLMFQIFDGRSIHIFCVCVEWSA